MKNPMQRGRIVVFREERNYGYVECEGERIFFHRSGCAPEHRDHIAEDRLVEFEIQQGPRGLQRAVRLKLID